MKLDISPLVLLSIITLSAPLWGMDNQKEKIQNQKNFIEIVLKNIRVRQKNNARVKKELTIFLETYDIITAIFKAYLEMIQPSYKFNEITSELRRQIKESQKTGEGILKTYQYQIPYEQQIYVKTILSQYRNICAILAAVLKETTPPTSPQT